MKLAVVGAGIVGVSTAYELSADGHDVTVFERRGSVAAEASFASAGLLGPAELGPWTAPGLPAQLLTQWFTRHPPLRVRPTLRPSTLRWLWKAWRASGARPAEANRARLQRLASYSRERLQHLTHGLQLDYERSEGLLLLLRNPAELARARPWLDWLDRVGVRHRVIDAAACREAEPWLNPDAALQGGVLLPEHGAGNCRQFAHLLRGEAQRLGASFRFHSTVLSLEPGSGGPHLTHLHQPPEDTAPPTAFDPVSRDAPHSTQLMPVEPVRERFDAIVVCAAVPAAALLRPHGLALPLRAVHGYAITAVLRQDMQHPDRGPRSALLDAQHRVSISRLGSRVRVAGGAEIGWPAERLHPASLDPLYKVLHDWFPGAARTEQAQRWKGARPALPDGPPVLGPSGLPGIWLNLGHGGNGWALACGSARLVADGVSGRPPQIDTSGLGVERLRA